MRSLHFMVYFAPSLLAVSLLIPFHFSGIKPSKLFANSVWVCLIIRRLFVVWTPSSSTLHSPEAKQLTINPVLSVFVFVCSLGNIPFNYLIIASCLCLMPLLFLLQVLFYFMLFKLSRNTFYKTTKVCWLMGFIINCCTPSYK